MSKIFPNRLRRADNRKPAPVQHDDHVNRWLAHYVAPKHAAAAPTPYVEPAFTKPPAFRERASIASILSRKEERKLVGFHEAEARYVILFSHAPHGTDRLKDGNGSFGFQTLGGVETPPVA